MKTKFKFIFLAAITLIAKIDVMGQATTAGALGTPNFNTGVEFEGFTNCVGPLNIQNCGTTYMQMSTTGLVGIGTATIPPGHQLDVTGEINIGAPTNYYMIDNFTVLHNFGSGNVFTGVGAGNFSLSGVRNSAFGVSEIKMFV